MFIHCVIDSQLWTAACMTLLLINLIDCQDEVQLYNYLTPTVIRLVKDSESDLLARGQASKIKTSILDYAGYTAGGRRANHKSSTPSTSRVVVLMKRSIPATDADNNLTTLVEPIEIIERVTNSSYDSLRSLTHKATRKMRENSPNKPNDRDDQHSPVDASKSSDGNLLSLIKSFLVTLTSKISNGAKSFERSGEGYIEATSEQTIVERRPKRLSKPEIIQKILSDINIENILRDSKKTLASSTNSGTGLSSLSSSNTNDNNKQVSKSIDFNQPDERLSSELSTKISLSKVATSNELIKSSYQKQTADSIKDDNRTVLKSKQTKSQSGATTSDQSSTSQSKSSTIIKSTSDLFKENLSIMLEDQLEEFNTTSIDLDHFIKLHQQQKQQAASGVFQPIDQLKKVMSFMHFG